MPERSNSVYGHTLLPRSVFLFARLRLGLVQTIRGGHGCDSGRAKVAAHVAPGRAQFTPLVTVKWVREMKLATTFAVV